MQEKNIGNAEKPDYFQCKAVINTVRNKNAFYKSCPTPECNRKVLDQNNGMFRCEKCNNEFPNFKYRLLLSVSVYYTTIETHKCYNCFYILQMSLGDWNSNRWATAFSDVAEALLGKSAQEVGAALEGDTELAESILAAIHFKSYVFKLRSKVEFYGVSTFV